MNDGVLTTNLDKKKIPPGSPSVEKAPLEFNETEMNQRSPEVGDITGAPLPAKDFIEKSQLPSPKQDEIDSLLADAEALSAEIVLGSVGPLNDVPTTLEAEDIIAQAVVANSQQAPDITTAEIHLPDDATSQESSSSLSVPRSEPDSEDRVDESVAELKDLLNDPDSKSADLAGIAVPEPVDESSPKPDPSPMYPVRGLPSFGESGSATALSDSEVAIPSRSRRNFGQWVKDFRKSLLSRSRSFIYIFLNCGFFCLTIFDIPFRGASTLAKQKMGLAGLVTILMGLAAWFLPGLLEQNPFEHMETGVATDAPAIPVAADEGEQH